MNRIRGLRFAIPFFLAALLAAACDGAAPPPPTSASRPADRDDLTKPYLSEAKISAFIASLKEDRNPFDLLFRPGRGMSRPGAQERVDELNAFARKHGFGDTEDYFAVWTRLTAARTFLWAEEMREKTILLLEKNAEWMEAELREPGLPQDRRKTLEEQLVAARKAIDERRKADAPELIHPADLALVRAHRVRIDDALERYKRPPEGGR